MFEMCVFGNCRDFFRCTKIENNNECSAMTSIGLINLLFNSEYDPLATNYLIRIVAPCNSYQFGLNIHVSCTNHK